MEEVGSLSVARNRKPHNAAPPISGIMRSFRAPICALMGGGGGGVLPFDMSIQNEARAAANAEADTGPSRACSRSGESVLQ